jgi:hypothetical protein
MMKFIDILDMMHSPLKKVVLSLGAIPQHPIHHPEGDVLIHTEVVTNRVIKYTNDIDLILSAVFHDLGKIDTLAFTETGIPTAHAHEKFSADLVREYADWIEMMGGNVDKIHYIVYNHMRVKKLISGEMRPAKKDAFIQETFFVDLMRFTQHDKGGTKI